MSVEQATDALSALIESGCSPPDRNDLGRLARMHTSCQTLAAAELGAAVVDELQALAQSLASLLEKLILDDVADADAGLALIPELVNQIQTTFSGKHAQVESLLAQVDAAILGPGAAPPAEESAIRAARSTPPRPDPSPAPAPPHGPRPAATPAPPRADESAIEAYVAEPLALDLAESEHLAGFVEESREHMDAIEAALLEVERAPSDAARINELFRPFHTIKGIAGFLNLRDINRLTHEVETILDLARRGERPLRPGAIELIFAAVDALKAQLGALAQFLANPSGDICPQPDVAALVDELRREAAGGGSPASASAAPRSESPEENSIAETPRADAIGTALPAAVAPPHAPAERSIRVDTARLDSLVDAVGELVIAQTMVGQSGVVQGDERLNRSVIHVTKIVRDIQETAMSLRMVPIGPTFQKLRRLVRDVSRKAGKHVELLLSGEETELDKNVIQQVSDPLVHMVRNAIDHGIEPTAERVAVGKPATGRVWLSASHQGDGIVIEIRDDGGGLSRERILAKARQRGLIRRDETPADSQIYALVMEAGFSTAQQVTDISGRGVGLDVVRRNVEQLRGKIEIETEAGRGSTFRIRLPLTLAIIDGMLVRVGSERMIIPTIAIERSLRPSAEEIHSVQGRAQMVRVRGELCPLAQLGPMLGLGGPLDPCAALVVLVQCGSRRLGLVVNELIGQQQVVIKALDERFRRVQGVSGAAILGDGRVGLILEPAGLLSLFDGGGSCGAGATFAPPAAAATAGAAF